MYDNRHPVLLQFWTRTVIAYRWKLAKHSWCNPMSHLRQMRRVLRPHTPQRRCALLDSGKWMIPSVRMSASTRSPMAFGLPRGRPTVARSTPYRRPCTRCDESPTGLVVGVSLRHCISTRSRHFASPRPTGRQREPTTIFWIWWKCDTCWCSGPSYLLRPYVCCSGQ